MNLPNKAPSSLHEIDLVNALLPQALKILQNDFTLSNVECDLSDFTGDVFSLRSTLVPLIELTGGPGSEAFYALLYRVDIPETRIREALDAANDQPIMSVIAELLIIRALQKAYYRAKFS